MANPPPYYEPPKPGHPPPAPGGYPQTYQPGYPPDYPPSYQGGAPPGYQPAPPPPSQTTTYVYQAPPVHVPMGNCPACQRGMLRDEFTLVGLCLAVVFFPIGILCCLAMTEKRCSSCGFLFYG